MKQSFIFTMLLEGCDVGKGGGVRGRATTN